MDTAIVYYDPSNIGQKTCLVIESRSRLHIVMIKSRGVVHLSVPASEAQYMRPAGVTLTKGLRSFGGIARRKGSTKAARTWLTKAREEIS